METKAKLGLIVATTPAGEIGYKNTIPWVLKGDLPRFKQLTMNSVIISGRTTHETLPAVMEGRVRIVLTRSPEYASEVHSPDDNIFGASSMEEALEIARRFKTEWIYFIGGAKIYEEAMELVDTAFVTVVYKTAPKYDTQVKALNFPKEKWVSFKTLPVMEAHPKHPEFLIPSHMYMTFDRIEQPVKESADGEA